MNVPYLSQFNHPALIIGVDSGLTMGVAVVRLAVIQKLVEGEENIVGVNLWDRGLHEGIATQVFHNRETHKHILDRCEDLVYELRIFIENEQKDFYFKNVAGKKSSYSKPTSWKSGYRQKGRYTNACRDTYVVIEAPKTFFTYKDRKGRKKDPEKIAKFACVTQALYIAFRHSDICTCVKRIITPQSTLKENARMMLMNRVNDEGLRDFWSKKSHHEIDAYMAAEHFIVNHIREYY